MGTVLAAPQWVVGGVSGQATVHMGRHQSVTKSWECHTSLAVGPGTIQAPGAGPLHIHCSTIQDEAVHELITKESYLQKSVHTFEKLTKLSSMYHKLLNENN